MGTNSKLHVQFTSRHWEGLGCNGETYSDRGYQNTWDVTRTQPGASGILVDYTGGHVGASFGSGTPQQRAQQFLAQIEPVLPGLSAKWNGRRPSTSGPAIGGRAGSYSYWKVGQYTRSPASSASGGQLLLRRRAHVDRLPGLPERRGRDGRAAGGGARLARVVVPKSSQRRFTPVTSARLASGSWQRRLQLPGARRRSSRS